MTTKEEFETAKNGLMQVFKDNKLVTDKGQPKFQYFSEKARKELPEKVQVALEQALQEYRKAKEEYYALKRVFWHTNGVNILAYIQPNQSFEEEYFKYLKRIGKKAIIDELTRASSVGKEVLTKDLTKEIEKEQNQIKTQIQRLENQENKKLGEAKDIEKRKNDLLKKLEK